MTTSFKRLIVALAMIVPVAALVSSPVLAQTHAKAKHTTSIHKISHKTHKKTTAPTAS